MARSAKKVKNTKRPKLYFSKGGAGKRPADLSGLKKQIEDTIKAERSKPESPGLEQPKVSITEKGQLSVARPKDEAIDFSRIKSLIKDRMDSGDEAGRPTGLKRVQTGIKGLDAAMGGGFLPSSINLVSGGSGTGKSIFAMQFLVNGIDFYNEKGVYITFEEETENVLRDMAGFSWDLAGKIKGNRLSILRYTPEQIEKVLKTGAGTVRDTIRSMNAKRIVIDSITAFLLLHENELDKRKVLLELFKAISKWGCTAILISEKEESLKKHEPSALEFEVDSVLLLYNIKRGDIRQRALEVMKMRATKHQSKIFPMQITENGITIYPDERVF